MGEVKFLRLGEVIDALKALPQTGDDDSARSVRFDFGYFAPTGVSSWRGVYAQLALEYSSNERIPLAALVTLLESAVGATFSGWKGGDFTMTRDTRLWVANPGDANHTAITGVTDHGYQVIINTAWNEDDF